MPLKQGNSQIIGVVSDHFTNPYTVKMLNELTRQLNARGCNTLLLNVDSRESFTSLLQKAGRLQVDGLVFLATLFSEELNIAAELLPSVPTLYLCSTDNADAQVVCANDYAAGVEIGHLLLAQGFQRFGYMKGQDITAPDRQRMAGYTASLAAANKSLDKLLVAGSDHREQAYQAMMAYLKQARASERINALFCENDQLAFGALQAVRDFGQGAHIAVVGFDDVDEARSSTWHLTSWTQRCDVQITEALNRLLNCGTDHSGAWQQGELQIRHSHLGKEVQGEMSKCGCASRH
ncbi:substrate-binding domain-containing protein [Winslowiella iniecta]|uniref:LacI family transcriptional regulator n=1 Tax=Winslowiella iniecta TaxID=1560201 RepID=A0A0L7TEL1_9GAMM|nr:substrate-binding domain-containing protein [Winslowiella iniecta]KOC90531.1 LacI family transcriptional regulator [Winslowiella iniecta]KOC93691.1 LacI family transcriptional regulator [Winslowiella iniecta]